MKKAGLLILILLTAYIGGIYGDPALMALAVAELLLAVVMWLLAGYMAGRLELQIPAARILAVRGQTFQCRVTVKSRGILPVSRFVVRIGSRYEGGGRREDKKVYGGAMPGESRLWVEERADHCGIRTFQAEEIRVYDYLALFSRKRKLGQAWEALILPPDMELRVRLEEAGAGRGGEMSRQSRASGSAYDEIRRIREYRPGDLQRHIHWNQTARSGQLWVKEYEEEQRRRAVLCLDVTGRAEDGFCLLLSALLRGLLRVCSGVSVFWYDEGEAGGKGRCVRWEMTDESGRPALFEKLYRTRWPEESRRGTRIEQVAGSVREAGAVSSAEDILTLDSNLALSRGRRLVRRFSSERLEEELAKMTVTL